MGDRLEGLGYAVLTLSSMPATHDTIIHFAPGLEQDAYTLASHVPTAVIEVQNGLTTDFRVQLGISYEEIVLATTPELIDSFEAWMGGGSSSNCDLEATSFENITPPYLGVPSGRVGIGGVIEFCMLGFDPGAEIDVTVENPDKTVTTFNAVTYAATSSPVTTNPLNGESISSAGGGINWYIPSSTPPGAYRFEAEQGGLTLSTELTIAYSPDDWPWVEPIGGTARLGESLIMAVSGLPPSSDVPLAIYHMTEWSVFEVLKPLEIQRSDHNGALIVEVVFDASMADLVGETLCLDGPQVANGLRSVGWSVCDAEASGSWVLRPPSSE